MSGTEDRLALEMLLVFGGAKLAAELFERLRMPGIVGEILCGFVLGPAVLNWIHPGATLSALAELGVMFLLFRVGLEVKAGEIRRVGMLATGVAASGVVVPFAMGWMLMRLWDQTPVESAFVACAMVATSVGITAQVLAARGLLQAMASRVILAAAVIDDVLGLLVLALVSSMAKGDFRWLDLALTATLSIGFTIAVTLWGTRVMGRLLPGVEQRIRNSEGQFTIAMILLFSLALLAKVSGVAAIIGAFLAGMALSESVSHRVHDLAHGITELLVPFFLAGIGLSLDVTTLTQPATLALSLAISAAAILSKLGGCGLAAWRLGHRRAWQIGAGMVPRGEVGMVVAQLGLTLGVISQPVYGVTVFMAILTTLVAPPLLSFAFRHEPPGKPVEDFKLG
jgi:Kef-type K+ transport system membrane component KefB